MMMMALMVRAAWIIFTSVCWVGAQSGNPPPPPLPPGDCVGDQPKRQLISRFSTTKPKVDGSLLPSEWASATRFTNTKSLKNVWLCEFSEILNPADLSVKGLVKHTDEALYFAFNITDNLIYGVDTPRWMPPGNGHADLLNASGWGFFGDEVEILIDASGPTNIQSDVFGNKTAWQMVVNTGKSVLGGIGEGGLIPGDRPALASAWAEYLSWIHAKSMQAASKVHIGGGGYVVEWRIGFELLHVQPGRPYCSSDPDTLVGLNIAVGDVDTPADGHPYYGIRHEQWFSGEKNNRTQIDEFGTLLLKSKN